MPDMDLVVTGSGEVRDADGNLINPPPPEPEPAPTEGDNQ